MNLKSLLKIFGTVITCCVVILICMNLDAKVYASVTYTEIIAENIDNTGGSNATRALQSYFDEARDNATDANPYKIILPKGTYSLDNIVRVYSNTYVVLKDVTFIRSDINKKGMIRIGDSETAVYGYNGQRNITFEGGVFDGTTSLKNYESLIRMAHCKNITFKNCKFINGKDIRYIELAGVDGFNVLDCTIIGGAQEKTHEIEAIQMDILHNEERIGDFAEYDDTPMKNVTIKGCTFKNLQKAVGGHTFIIGVYTDYVNITNNTFENITRAAISIENYRNCVISDNKFIKCGMAVDFKYMRSKESFSESTLNRDYEKVPMANNIKNLVIDHDAKTIIKNNAMDIVKTSYYKNPIAIRVFGENIDSTTAKYASITAGDYYVKNVKISGNTINTEGIGIRLGDARNITVDKNIITYTGEKVKSTNYPICAYDNSIALNITGNTIKNASIHSIYILNKISKNTKANCEINNNKIINSGRCGINLSESGKSNTVSGNTITKSGEEAILYFNTGGTISKNTIKTTKKHGISITGFSAVIKENTISDISNKGIQIKDDATATITNNKITSCKVYGICIDNADKKSTVTGNIVTKSKLIDIYLVSKSMNLKLNSYNKPSTPTLKVKKGSITVSVKEMHKNAKYIIYRKTGKGKYKKIATSSKTKYVDKKVKKGTKYSYKVVAVVNNSKSVVTSLESKISKTVTAK